VTPVDALFEEFVTRWTRDEPIDVAGLLERAGPETDELARLIDTFFERAPRREPSDESRAAVAAIRARFEAEPPLVRARVAARRKVGDVVSEILASAKLPRTAEPLVRANYQRLEGGLLDPEGVADVVWSVLERVLGPGVRAQARDAFSWKRRAFAETLAFQRLAGADAAAFAAAPAAAAREEPPEELRRRVDELFTGRSPEH